jgi:choice-of-anchor B domain-containing protein
MKHFLTVLLTALSLVLHAQNYNIQQRAEMDFPGETVANVFGYTKDGREYALVGGSLKTHIVEVTNPDAPVLIASFPFVNSLWKEIRTYQNIAYITTEGGNAGLQIIDLSGLPNSNLSTYRYYGDGAIAGQLQTIHALQVDETKGFLYLFGSNLGNGGAIVCDISDPYTPVYAGQYNLNYIHDGYADNDTLYGSHINEGYFSVIDMSDKNNPVVLATQTTPNVFTHNTWITKDRKHLLTTDETANSYVASYDISDLTDIKELDRLQCTPGSGSTAHNTYVRGDHAVTAWYTDGVNIIDCTRPSNIVQTGWYDTYPGSGSGFDGAWGVYPYFPSGNLIVSNINPGKIFVLTPTYTRASYFEGNVKNAATGQNIQGAAVELYTTDLVDKNTTKVDGKFALGTRSPGQYLARCSKLGFVPQEIVITLIEGEVVTYDFSLQEAMTYTLGGSVKDAAGNPIPNAKVVLQEAEAQYDGIADVNGLFSVSGVLPSTYSVIAGVWGYKTGGVESFDISGNASIDIILEKGYKDDFALDLGWTVESTSLQGQFERAEPVGIMVQGIELSPEEDIATDLGRECYITGNEGVGFSDDDLQEGNTILKSPIMDFTGYSFVQIRFSTAFISIASTGVVTQEKMRVLINNGTIDRLLLQRTSTFDSGWKNHTIILPQSFALTNNMQVRVEVNENFPGEFVVTEAAFDAFEVLATSATRDLLDHIDLQVQPNPFANTFLLTLGGTIASGTAVVTNALGQVVETRTFEGSPYSLEMGAALPNGLYFVAVQTDAGMAKAVRVVKGE